MTLHLRHIFLVVALLPLLFTKAYGSSENMLKARYTTDDGLSSNSISDIIRDRQGYMWIATWDGLSRFDGFEFINYETGSGSNIPGMHNRIRKLFEDSAGNIWLMMYDEKLFMLDRRTDSFQDPLADMENSRKLRINSLQEDSGGNLWANAGADGAVYIPVASAENSKPALLSVQGTVRQIYEDSLSNIWIITDRNAYYVPPANRQQLYLPENLKGHEFTCVAGSSGKIYFGTSSGGLVEYDPANGEASVASNFTGEILRLAGSPHDHMLYLSVKGTGLVRFDPAVRKERIIARPAENITSIHIDSEGAVWAMPAGHGVIMYDNDRQRYSHFKQDIIIPLFTFGSGQITETDGKVWVNCHDGSLGCYDRATGSFSFYHNVPDDYFSAANVVISYHTDRSGALWLATQNRGLDKVISSERKIDRVRLEQHPTSAAENELRALYVDRSGYLWMASKAGTIYRLDKSFKVVERIDRDNKGEPVEMVYAITQGPDGDFWLGTKGNGLYRMSPDKEGRGYRFSKYVFDPKDPFSISSDDVYSIVTDTENRIWVGTYGGGINLIMENNGKTVFYSYRNFLKGYPQNECSKIRSLASSADGSIWAGTTEGAVEIRYAPSRKDVECGVYRKTHGSETSISNNDVIYIYRDSSDALWFATFGGGLNRLTGRGERAEPLFRSYTTKDGLPSNEIRSIVEDSDGIIWFSTENNVCFLDPSPDTFSVISRPEGIDNTMMSESAAAIVPENKIVFGTVDGYYLIDKELFTGGDEPGFMPAVTDILINDHTVYGTGGNGFAGLFDDTGLLRLPRHNKFFGFRFGSLNYSLQGRVRYQYMLEGYDNEWVTDNGSRKASYSDIPGGEYVFRVKAFLPERPDRYETAELRVFIPVSFWKTPFAYVIYALLLLTAAAGGWWWFYQRPQRKIKNMRTIKIGPSEIAFRDDSDYKFISSALGWLESHYTEPDIKIEDMVKVTGMSRTSFYNRLKSLIGMSPIELVTDFRLKKARMYLKETNLTITEIAYKTGFNDPVYFTRVFKKTYDIIPSEYRKQLSGEQTKVD